jgi:ABC-2 type transport system ATP-binding protein
MINAPAIEVRNLRKVYTDGLVRRRKIAALAGVSLEVPRGEIFGLLGPNGAGKTTLIKVLLGIVRRTSGDASMLGHPAGHRPTRRYVGYLPEGHRIPRHLTGYTALEFFGNLSGMSNSAVRAKRDDLLKLVGLEGWGKVSVRKYSKGMQQRLGLAQAMLHDPQLLILDEPTDGVDPVGRADIRRIMQELKRQGKTVFLNSHLLQEVELVCDRVAILDHGRLQRVGSVAELTRQPSLAAGVVAQVTVDIVFVVQAEDGRALSALRGHSIGRARPLGAGQTEVVVGAADQVAVDRAVDALRSAGISIISMAPQRRTLEEAFIEIVGEA